MRLPAVIYSQACLAAIGMMLIVSLSGCGMMSQYQCRGQRRACSRQLLGVEDQVLHGYRKTCWQNWDNAASADSCPTYSEDHADPARLSP